MTKSQQSNYSSQHQRMPPIVSQNQPAAGDRDWIHRPHMWLPALLSSPLHDTALSTRDDSRGGHDVSDEPRQRDVVSDRGGGLGLGRRKGGVAVALSRRVHRCAGDPRLLRDARLHARNHGVG